VLRLYDVEQIRGVATSAVREATNADTLLDRILMATGLHVEVIGTAEESRLTVSAVRQAAADVLETGENTLIADVGGGSTLLTVLHKDEIVNSMSLRLGTIRLQELLGTSEESPERSADLYRQHILNETATTPGSLSLDKIDTFIAVGSDARFAAHEVGKETASSDLHSIGVDNFDKLVKRCIKRTPEDLSKRYGMPFSEAETLNPALLVYQILLKKTRADQMIVSNVSMRDGLLLELASSVTGQEDEAAHESVMQSAISVAEKYHTDMDHAKNVAEIAVRLFDQLQADHGLGPRPRLLLRIAGVLHETGAYISDRSHHKHSYYLIINAELFGLSREELITVAHVARYHRRSGPKPSHIEYTALPREQRVLINKLAAILRVADALSQGHIPNPSKLQFERQGDDLIVFVPDVANMLLEKRALARKGDLFEEIYGMRMRLEEA
jgi:exopolyphosphatase/guanosine-5'-triphosphate,3'-diphosphate pyrophosphatase